MKQIQPLMQEWAGMSPDRPRDRMPRAQVWRMEDYIAGVMGSQLESRSGWTYHVTTPLGGGHITAQIWVNTLGGRHHLALTPGGLYNLDNPASPRLVLATTFPGLWPMATLYEYVLVPRPGDVLPIVLRYAAGVEVLVTTHASTPPAKVATTWQSRFVLGNTTAAPNRLYFLSQEWVAGMTTTPLWDPKAYWDTTADITGLAASRNSLLIFHEGTVERLRGTKAPGESIDDDVWMEPLIGQGGCNEPHSICYWNDNIIFADARGVYITDGTQIKDITAQGGIGREWRRSYDPAWRVAAGVVYGSYVVTMTDIAGGTFKRCFVCDLDSRNWTIFKNVPFSSLVATLGEQERLFGGGLDGKVANLSDMWTEADPTTDNVDGNGVAVLPQLETAWYRLSDDERLKRVKHVYFSFDFAETNGSLKVYFCEEVQPRSPADWVLGKTFTEGDMTNAADQPVTRDGYERRRIAIGRESYGFAFKVETTGTIRNLKLHALEAELQPSREATYA